MPDRFRIFISHASSVAGAAAELKGELDWWGCDAFVAHQDIEPGTEWVAEIRAGLGQCEALVAIVNEDFRSSRWCDQEVGWVLGRNVPVVPVRRGLTPYGLLGSIQAASWSASATSSAVAREVVMVLGRDTRSRARAIDALLSQLLDAESFAQANGISLGLVELGARLSASQLEALARAIDENPQLDGAYDVRGALAALRQIAL